MKNFLLIISLIIFLTSPVFASTLKGKVVCEVSTFYPKDIIEIYVTHSTKIKNIFFKKGYIVKGSMTEVKSLEKGDTEASFVFTILGYKDLDGIEKEVLEEIKTKYMKKHFQPTFLKDVDISLSPVAMPIQTEALNTSPSSYKNLNIKPISIVNSLMPDELKCDDEFKTDYKEEFSSDKEDILLLEGDKIKFDFPY